MKISVFIDMEIASSAIKILKAKNGTNLRFMYEYLNWLELTPLGHNRHYISMIKPMRFYCPDLQSQENIANIIRKTKRATPSERNVPKIKRNDSPSQNEAYL